MASKSDRTPLVVILGETGSGKSALAMYLAQKFNGEIITADSRTIYKDLNIVTAKPSSKDQSKVTHYLLDIITPDKSFSAAEFKSLASKAIDTITSKGKIPFLVGGTGLYIYSLIYDFNFKGDTNPKLRAKLNSLSVEELQNLIYQRGLSLPKDSLNPRRLIRTIEANGQVPEKRDLRPDSLLIGMKVDQLELKGRIANRVNIMIKRGVIKEVKNSAQTYGWDAPGLQSPGSKALRNYIEGKSNLEEATSEFIRRDLQLARRQRAWFKNNQSIQWVTNRQQAVDLLTTYLNK